METKDNLKQMLSKKPQTVSNPPAVNTAGSSIPIPIAITAVTTPQPEKQPPQQPAPTVKEKKAGKDIKICVVLPESLDGFIKDVQFAEILRTGNTKFSYKEALCTMIEYYKNNNAVVPQRPK